MKTIIIIKLNTDTISNSNYWWNLKKKKKSYSDRNFVKNNASTKISLIFSVGVTTFSKYFWKRPMLSAPYSEEGVPFEIDSGYWSLWW